MSSSFEPRRWVLLETAPWGHHLRLPGHHLASWLARRGDKVAYVSAPVSPWHFLSPTRRDLALRRWKATGRKGRWDSDNLFVYVPRTLLPIHQSRLLDTTASWLLAEALTLPRATQVLRKAGFLRPDVLLAQNFQIHQLAETLQPKVFGVRIEDRLDHFDGMPGVILRNLPALMQRADFCTVTARSLVDYAGSLGARDPLYVPNGVDVTRMGRPAELPPRPAELPGGRVAIYVGTIDHWFDADLLCEVASRRKDWSFVIVGPISAHRERLAAVANICLLPARPQEELAPLLWHADAGIIPFRRTPLIESVAPLKLFEYLAAGLPVVSTRWREMELLGSPAALATTAEEFADALSGSGGDSTREERMTWARGYDWERIFEALVAEIDARWLGVR